MVKEEGGREVFCSREVRLEGKEGWGLWPIEAGKEASRKRGFGFGEVDVRRIDL
jgi:hypothetical protein